MNCPNRIAYPGLCMVMPVRNLRGDKLWELCVFCGRTPQVLTRIETCDTHRNESNAEAAQPLGGQSNE